MRFSKSKYLYKWILATVCGALLVNAIAFALNTLLIALFATPVVIYGFGLRVLVAILIGIASGSCQWYVLKDHFKKAYWWIVATVIGEILTVLMVQATGFYSVMLFPSVPSLLDWLSPLIIALLPGVAQWFFFDGRVKRAWLWVVFSLLAEYSIPKLIASYVYNGLVPLSDPIGIVLIKIVFWGVVLGGMTGIPLLSFIAQKNRQNSTGLL